MTRVALLRFDAPLMSFGGPMVDSFGATQRFPGLSMLTGLCANALGYEHREHEPLAALQARLRYAVRCDRPGKTLRDYQTVDLGQPFLVAKNVAWTTWGHLDERGGGDAKESTHIRYRDYLADAAYAVALRLEPEDAAPTLDQLASALESPARPLFLGRKACLPSVPIFASIVEAESLLDALLRAPRLRSSQRQEKLEAEVWWPADELGPASSRLVTVTDERDWRNQIHAGSRQMRHGQLCIEALGDE